MGYAADTRSYVNVRKSNANHSLLFAKSWVLKNVKQIVVTGGGTAGHVIPAIPIIKRLLEDGLEVSFVGSTSGLEELLMEDLEIPFYGITTGKLRRYFSIENLVDVFRVFKGVSQAYSLMRRIKPLVVFSKGGYVAFPVVFAAWLNRIPVVAHESDLTPGFSESTVSAIHQIVVFELSGNVCFEREMSWSLEPPSERT